MSLDRRRFVLAGGAVMAGLSTVTAGDTPDDRAAAFIDAHVKKMRPLDVAGGIAWWNANTTGNDADFAKKEAAQNAIDVALADPKTFETLKAIKTAGGLKNPQIARQIELLYLLYLEKQVPADLLKAITAKANAVEKTFNVYRATINGTELSDSQVRKVLKESTNSDERRQVWEASKGVGAKVEADLKALVRLRNQAATHLGYANFHALTLALNEQTGPELLGLFDELDALTREPFQKAKADIDARLAKACGVTVDRLRPWHYHDPFFQESPAVFDTNIDKPYEKADILELCRRFYSGIGLPIDDVIARSDLFEKKGKSPHAFCTDIDREGDVRVLANIVGSEYWMGTMLHELGHAVYSSKNIPQAVPYVLRSEAHVLTTEGVAMQFQKFSKSRAWLEQMGIKVDDPAGFDTTAAKMLRNELLIFSRWCQVMLRFEQGMYEKPEQDLNKLWWDLVEKYQGLTRPDGRNAPDYASKIHICSAPVYYHNYMMGQLFASQVHHALCKTVLKVEPTATTYINDKRVGAFMKAKVFEPGKSLSWNELTKFATGEGLNARAFAADFSG